MDTYMQEVLEGKRILLFDGAMGTMVQRKGLIDVCELPDLLCLQRPEAVTEIHTEYVTAGAQAILTNTFNTNPVALPDGISVAELMHAAVACVQAAGAPYIVADVSSLGELLEPYGDMEEEQAVEYYEEVASAINNEPVDLIMIETMADLREAQIAVRAAKKICDLPVFASMSFGAGDATFMGVTPEQAAVGLREAGADVVGMNCSLGPDAMVPLVTRMRAVVDCPITVLPNAGLPIMKDGETAYDVTIDEFVCAVERILDAGATIIGGCCGTDPSYIAALKKLIDARV